MSKEYGGTQNTSGHISQGIEFDFYSHAVENISKVLSRRLAQYDFCFKKITLTLIWRVDWLVQEQKQIYFTEVPTGSDYDLK